MSVKKLALSVNIQLVGYHGSEPIQVHVFVANDKESTLRPHLFFKSKLFNILKLNSKLFFVEIVNLRTEIMNQIRQVTCELQINTERKIELRKKIGNERWLQINPILC